MIILEKVKDTWESEGGFGYTCQGELARLKNINELRAYLKEHTDLKENEVRAFSGSSSLIEEANDLIKELLHIHKFKTHYANTRDGEPVAWGKCWCGEVDA